ncbi:MAG: hypothetical protein NT115_09830 [Proteobacteria bacterium]|nr:hypothetical protein [Pseudomonadota bacterium]
MQGTLLIPLIVACALFMENMDSTVLATSLPAIALVIGAYALQLASTLQGHDSIVTSDFWPAFVVIALISAASLLFHTGLAADAGAEIAGRLKQAPKPPLT